MQQVGAESPVVSLLARYVCNIHHYKPPQAALAVRYCELVRCNIKCTPSYPYCNIGATLLYNGEMATSVDATARTRFQYHTAAATTKFCSGPCSEHKGGE